MDELRSDNIQNFLLSKNPGGVLKQLNAHEVNQLFDKLREHNEHMTSLARLDPLTQLPNRFCFETSSHRIEAQAKRRNQKFSVLCIDLDGFKQVNDQYGHSMGDRVLKSVAQVLMDTVRKEDLVARVGGDEFVVILPCIEHYADSGHVARKIINSVSQIAINDYPDIAINCCIGIANYPAAGDNLKELLHRADKALFAAKARGTSIFEYFTTKIKQEHQYGEKLIATLKKYVSQNQLSLSYLPIYAVTSEQLVGVQVTLHGLQEIIPYLDMHDTFYGELAAAFLDKLYSDFLQFKANNMHDMVMFINVNQKILNDAQFKKKIRTLVGNDADFASCIRLRLVGEPGTALSKVVLDFYKSINASFCFTYQVDRQANLARLRDVSPDYIDISVAGIHSHKVSVERNRDFLRGLLLLVGSLGIDVLLSGVDSNKHKSLLSDVSSGMMSGYLFSTSLSQADFIKLCCHQS